MMNYLEYCKRLNRADRIVIAISQFYRHHAIFWGWDTEGQGWIIENGKGSGVRFIRIEEFFYRFNATVELIAFAGTEEDRNEALTRAMSQLGSSYHLTAWNCEQFANYVQCNKVNSKQVKNTFLVAGIGVAIWLGGRQ